MADSAEAEARTAGIGPLDIAGILSALPHRYPMLLVDRVDALVPGRSIRAVKAVTFNEPFFQGHFPGRPIMPGVLIVEALAQAAGVLAIKTLEIEEGGRSEKLVYFMAIDEAKFRVPVEPGVLLTLECELVQRRGAVSKVSARALLGDRVATTATLTAMVADPPKR